MIVEELIDLLNECPLHAKILVFDTLTGDSFDADAMILCEDMVTIDFKAR